MVATGGRGGRDSNTAGEGERWQYGGEGGEITIRGSGNNDNKTRWGANGRGGVDRTAARWTRGEGRVGWIFHGGSVEGGRGRNMFVK